MQPPKSAVGTLAVGLGAIAVGTLAGAYIGSRLLPVGKRFGAMQGGYIGAIATSTGAVLVSVVDPNWARPASVAALTGLTAFLIANVASVVQTNKSFASLDDIMPGLTAAAAGEEPELPVSTATTPGLTTPQPQVITLGTDNNNQAVSVKVGDTIVLSLPVTDGSSWYYVPDTSTALVFGSRSQSSTSTLADTWQCAIAGTYKLDVQLLPTGAVAGTAPQSELIYNITVS